MISIVKYINESFRDSLIDMAALNVHPIKRLIQGEFGEAGHELWKHIKGQYGGSDEAKQIKSIKQFFTMHPKNEK